MTAFISIIASKKSSVSAIIDLLQQWGYRTDRFVGENASGAFLKKPPRTVDLLIIDYDLAEMGDFRFLKQISESDRLSSVPVLFLAETDELQEIQILYLQPGSFDFIDPESGLQYLPGRVSVLLEISKIRTKTKSETKRKSQNSFIASLSHDLRNPIHGILSYSKFGIKKTQNDQLSKEKSQYYYQSIKDAGTRLLDLLNDILELAKLNDDKIPFDICQRNLGTVAQGAISELFKEIKNNQLSLTLNEPEIPVQGLFDAKQVGQVIRRLLVNCFQTAETSANIILKIETIKPLPEDLSTLDSPAIRFSLHHPEARFSEERLDDLQRLFNKDRDVENTLGQMGLNFAICQRIVTKHKGRIWVESPLGGGVVFGFDLPMARKGKEIRD
jgi:signal transduction histidine kinase